jgi:hypothetical protein
MNETTCSAAVTAENTYTFIKYTSILLIIIIIIYSIYQIKRDSKIVGGGDDIEISFNIIAIFICLVAIFLSKLGTGATEYLCSSEILSWGSFIFFNIYPVLSIIAIIIESIQVISADFRTKKS